MSTPVLYFHSYYELEDALAPGGVLSLYRDSIRAQLRRCVTPLRAWECVQVSIRSGFPRVGVTLSPRFMNLAYVGVLAVFLFVLTR
jgi:hypothetical protein